jgi:hypothetical protein
VFRVWRSIKSVWVCTTANYLLTCLFSTLDQRSDQSKQSHVQMEKGAQKVNTTQARTPRIYLITCRHAHLPHTRHRIINQTIKRKTSSPCPFCGSALCTASRGRGCRPFPERQSSSCSSKCDGTLCCGRASWASCHNLDTVPTRPLDPLGPAVAHVQRAEETPSLA